VLEIVKYHTGAKVINPESRIFHDFKIDGTDAYELMVALEKKFDVDMANFTFVRHFGPEAPFNPFIWIYWMLFERDKLNESCSAVRQVPLTVLDLYQAAKTKKFPYLSERPAE
jgi:hypothetical protein